MKGTLPPAVPLKGRRTVPPETRAPPGRRRAAIRRCCPPTRRSWGRSPRSWRRSPARGRRRPSCEHNSLALAKGFDARSNQTEVVYVGSICLFQGKLGGNSAGSEENTGRLPQICFLERQKAKAQQAERPKEGRNSDVVVGARLTIQVVSYAFSATLLGMHGFWTSLSGLIGRTKPDSHGKCAALI